MKRPAERHALSGLWFAQKRERPEKREESQEVSSKQGPKHVGAFRSVRN